MVEVYVEIKYGNVEIKYWERSRVSEWDEWVTRLWAEAIGKEEGMIEKEEEEIGKRRRWIMKIANSIA